MNWLVNASKVALKSSSRLHVIACTNRTVHAQRAAPDLYKPCAAWKEPKAMEGEDYVDHHEAGTSA